jgi:hypothetical protein
VARAIGLFHDVDRSVLGERPDRLSGVREERRLAEQPLIPRSVPPGSPLRADPRTGVATSGASLGHGVAWTGADAPLVVAADGPGHGPSFKTCRPGITGRVAGSPSAGLPLQTGGQCSPGRPQSFLTRAPVARAYRRHRVECSPVSRYRRDRQRALRDLAPRLGRHHG